MPTTATVLTDVVPADQFPGAGAGNFDGKARTDVAFAWSRTSGPTVAHASRHGPGRHSSDLRMKHDSRVTSALFCVLRSNGAGPFAPCRWGCGAAPPGTP